MKRALTLVTKFTNLSRVWLPVMGGLLLGGCGSEQQIFIEEPAGSSEKGPTYTLAIQLTTNGIFTRGDNGTWEDDYNQDEGTPFDKTITSVDLFLVSEENKITPLYALEKPGSAAHIYECSVTDKTPGVTIDHDTKTAKFKGRIMAYANMWDNDLIGSGMSDWYTKKLPFNVRYGISEEWYIPMWGIESYETDLQPDATTILDEIYMLRAVSKIVVKLSPSLKESYKIKRISMGEESPRMNGSGYGLPGGDLLTIASTKKLNISSSFNPKPGSEKIEEPYWKIDETAQSAITYMAESNTDSDNPFRFKIELESLVEGRPDFIGTLYFSKYNLQNPSEREETVTEVIRNHEYEFTIHLAELQLQTTLKEWVWGGKVYIDL